MSEETPSTENRGRLTTRAQCLCNCSENNSDPSDADTRLLLHLLKSATDATKAVADVARLQAEAEAARREDEKTTQGGRGAVNTANTQMTASTVSPGPISGFVINERVGSVSRQEWEGMSPERLQNLDTTLRRIVTAVIDNHSDWIQLGTTIHRELATVGLNFKTVGDFNASDATQDWNRAKDKSLTELARVRSAMRVSRCHLGSNQWYPDEMLRIVQRLMELRGFQD